MAHFPGVRTKMNIIITGPQASGKGTQAKLLVEKFSFQYMETGKILRRLIEKGGELGKKLDTILNQKGTLVPDSLMIKIIKREMSKADLSKGVIFDGYPRNLEQYETLREIFKEFGIKTDWVVYVSISRDESLRRLSARRICPRCQKEYNLLTKLPKATGKCDNCGQELVARADDNPKTIIKRLQVFNAETKPVIEQARKEGLLLEVDGERPVGEIHQEIVIKLGLSSKGSKVI